MAWIAVLVVGVVAYLVVLRTAVATQNVNFVPSLLLLGSAVVPGTVLTFAATGGPRIFVSSGLLALVAVLGGIIGPSRPEGSSTTRCVASARFRCSSSASSRSRPSSSSRSSCFC